MPAIRLERDPEAALPEVPFEVVDAFGRAAQIVVQHGRWSGLVVHEGEVRFARLVDGRLHMSAMSTGRRYGQLLDTDDAGRTLVLGGKGESLFAVEPDGAARCLGVLGEDASFQSATWLADGGVAALIGDELCAYGPTREGPFVGRARWRIGLDRSEGVRRLPGSDVVIVTADDRLLLVAGLDGSAEARELARFEGLELASAQFFLDETGARTALLDAALVCSCGEAHRFVGLDAALVGDPLARSPAPALARGEDHPAPADASVAIAIPIELDASPEPELERLHSMTRALIRMLRSAPARPRPDMDMLELIRPGMPDDLRAYVHAWATHQPAAPTVDEFWLAAPRRVTEPYLHAFIGNALHLGTFASGEPILARLASGPSCEVVMIDEVGVPYRYPGIEGFLADLSMRRNDDERRFELDAWMDGTA